MGAGSGIALLYVISALGIVAVGITGFTIRRLREAERLMPDHDC